MPSAGARGTRPNRACAACGACEMVVCHHQEFVVPDGYPLPSDYNVVCCRSCGFVYADSHASQCDYDRFYREWSKYDDSVTSTGGGFSPYDAARLAATAADIERLLPARNLRILDAGCATGGLLCALREQGFISVCGLDSSPRCAAACRDRGFPVYVGSITSAPADIPKFDCIVLSHVLEHVYDIPAFFTAARRLLSPGGYLYLETPDATRYVDYLYAPFQEFNTEHINHFSPRALENIAQRFGFATVVATQKLIQTARDIFYPAAFGIFLDCGHAAESNDVTWDHELPSKIAEYVEQSAELMERISHNLSMQLSSGQRVVLWGAGQLAMKLLTLPSLREAEVLVLVDSNPILHGKTLASVPVVSPAEIAGSTEPILITTLLHTDEIVTQIRQLGLHNPILHLLTEQRAMGVSKP